MLGGYSQEAIDKPLHHYQFVTVDWMLERFFVLKEQGVAVFLDPGLGKTRITLTVIDFLLQMGEIRKALILAPLRPIYTVWPAEIKRWGFPISYQILHDTNVIKALKNDVQLELINYESTHKIENIKDRWDFLGCDESTFVKNWGRHRSKRTRKIGKSTTFRVLLTGTPAANNLADLHAQIYLLDEGKALGKTAGYFRRKYCRQDGQAQWNRWKVRKDCIEQLKEDVKHMVIRLKAEDHIDMPKLVDNRIWCRMDSKTAAQYRKLKRELYAELQTGSVLAGSAAAAYAKCRQFANGRVYDEAGVVHIAHKEKVKALLELYEGLAGKPLFIAYYYHHDLEAIQEGIGNNHPFKNAPVIRGKRKGYSMPLKKLAAILEGWNNGDYPAIICQYQAVSHGNNMQGACNDMAFFGLHPSLETIEQIKRRVYRQGVKGDQVRLHKILMEDTVDVTIQDDLDGKFNTQEAFLEALKRHAA